MHKHPHRGRKNVTISIAFLNYIKTNCENKIKRQNTSHTDYMDTQVTIEKRTADRGCNKISQTA